jgi:hypothetical protein
MKEPFLKGKLTALWTSIFALSQSPELIGDLFAAPEVFKDAADKPASVVGVIAALGILYGTYRRIRGYK